MPRMSNEQKIQVITDLLTAAGGELSHNDLVAQLTEQSHAALATELPRLTQARLIKASVKARPDGPPVLSYTLPNQPEAAPAEPAASGPAPTAPTAPAAPVS